jgi:hypothetical protein
MAKFNPDLLELFETTHTYYYDRREIINVTTILEMAGLSDYSRVPANLLDRAQTFGRALHKGTELLDLGKIDVSTIHPDLAPYLDGWKAFVKDHVVEFISIEEKIADLGKWYAGTLDRVGLMRTGKLGMIEVKSSDTLHPAAALQTAGYKKPWERIHGQKIETRIAVQPTKTGGYIKTDYDNDREDYADFLAALRIANRKIKDKIR